MARKGRQAVRNGGWPAWLLVLIGIIVGAIAMGIVNHTGRMPISRSANTPQPSPQSAQSSDGAGIAAQAQSDKPKYDFYSVLPEKDVVIPDAEIDAQVKAEKQQAQQPDTGSAQGDNTAGNVASNNDTGTAATTNGGEHYLLQVGSFPSSGDAEALKAKLALKGFRAEIQPVTINGQTWNRVRLGPFSSASSLEAAKNKLESAGIHAIALKEH